MRRRNLIIGASAGVLVLVALAGWLTLGRDGSRVRVAAGAVTASHGTRVDARLYLPHDASPEHPKPAVLLGHGLGGEHDDVEDMALMFARAGYVVRTWTSRGQRGSDGAVGIAGPDAEVADAQALIDDLSWRSSASRTAVASRC